MFLFRDKYEKTPSRDHHAVTGAAVQPSTITQRSVRARIQPEETTSPVDNVIIGAFAPSATWLAEQGVTPNHLSLLGGFLALASLLALYHGYLVAFVLLFAASYTMDAVDGWMARTFSLFSPWGEALDHWKDVLVTVLLVIVVVWKRRPHPAILYVIGCLYILAFFGESCAQRDIEQRKATRGFAQQSDNMLNNITAVCPPSMSPTATRHIATPSFLLLMGVSICVYCAWRAQTSFTR